MTTLSDRINTALKSTGTRKVDLARAIEVKPQIIQFLCNSKTKASRYTFEIAAALGLSIEWLATGKGHMFATSYEKKAFDQEYIKIPILDNNQILNGFCNEIDSKDTKTIVIERSIGDVYCTSVMDNSMTPLLKPSSLIIFKETKPGEKLIDDSILICKLHEMNTVIIRKLITTEGRKTLIPENTAIYNTIELKPNISIIGTVIENRCSFNCQENNQ